MSPSPISTNYFATSNLTGTSDGTDPLLNIFA